MPSDFRKYYEQQAYILRCDQSNKNYIMAQGVSGVDWRFDKSPRPAPVFDIYVEVLAGGSPINEFQTDKRSQQGATRWDSNWPGRPLSTAFSSAAVRHRSCQRRLATDLAAMLAH